jgi:Protein of unknown function (DUF4058)
MFDPIFPGMDPFIEGQRWMAFHNALVTAILNELSRLLVPQYDVNSEGYIYLHMRPDVYVLRGKSGTEPFESSSLAIADASRIFTPTIYEVDEQPRIEVRDDEGRLVTVIEVLSPSNKAGHRDRYLANRDAILYSSTHLIELDLLRGGKRMEADFPNEGYVLMVARAQPNAPHRGEVYEVGLRDPLPVLPVPLAKGDADVPLNLPELVRAVYIAARYRLQLDYNKMPAVPFSSEDAAWVAEQINAADLTP